MQWNNCRTWYNILFRTGTFRSAPPRYIFCQGDDRIGGWSLIPIHTRGMGWAFHFSEISLDWCRRIWLDKHCRNFVILDTCTINNGTWHDGRIAVDISLHWTIEKVTQHSNTAATNRHSLGFPASRSRSRRSENSPLGPLAIYSIDRRRHTKENRTGWFGQTHCSLFRCRGDWASQSTIIWLGLLCLCANLRTCIEDFSNNCILPSDI